MSSRSSGFQAKCRHTNTHNGHRRYTDTRRLRCTILCHHPHLPNLYQLHMTRVFLYRLNRNNSSQRHDCYHRLLPIRRKEYQERGKHKFIQLPVIINCPRTIMTIKTVQRKEIQVTRDRHECLRHRDMSIYWRQSFVVNYDQVCRMKRKKSVILSIKSLNNKKIVTNFMTVNVAAPQLPNRQQLSIYKLLTN